MSNCRTEIIERISNKILQLQVPHTLRVGIDGIGAAGKTIFADELAEALRDKGRNVIRCGLDGFHHPAEHRQRRGRFSAEGYLEDSFDFDAVRTHVLDPLGPNGDGCYFPALHDLHQETSIQPNAKHAPANSILLFEGVLLFNPQLNDCFDLRLFLRASFKTALARARVRDHKRLGSVEQVENLYRKRYIPGQMLHLERNQPEQQAHHIIELNDPLNPQWIR